MYLSASLLIREIGATAVRVGAYIGALVALALLAQEVFRTAPVAAVEPQLRPDWVQIERPAAAFQAILPELGDEGRYTIKRHERGGGRKDIITFGEPGRTTRYVMLEIYRPGEETPDFSDAVSEIAARAEDFAPPEAVHASFPIDTKFGAIDTADFPASRAGGQCVGFVRSFTAPRLQLAGLSCNMDTLVDRAALACILDRLTLLTSGSDPKVAGVFARAEVNRKFCGQRDPLMYATPKRPGSNEAAVPLKLRGSFASR